MKKIILLSAIFFMQFVFSQMVVTDVGATAKLAEQVTTSTKSLKQLQGTYELMQKANEKVQQVNGFVQQAGHFQNIINKQKEAIRSANQLLKIAKARNMNLSGVTQNLQMISGSIKTVQALLKNGVFNMNDSERLDRLEKEYQKVSQYEFSIKTKLIQSSFR